MQLYPTRSTFHVAVAGAGLLARLCGDEFAVVLTGLDPGSADARIARLHTHVSEEISRRGWPVGVSIGAVTFPFPRVDVDRMIQRADLLMYTAKRKGKRRVEHAIADETDSDASSSPSGQRRAIARVLEGCPARVRPQGTDGSDVFATVRDLTAWKACLHLERCFAAGTVLVVEPLSASARTLLVRVESAQSSRGGWLHHCAMSARLSDDELTSWLGNVEASLGQTPLPISITAHQDITSQ